MAEQQGEIPTEGKQQVGQSQGNTTPNADIGTRIALEVLNESLSPRDERRNANPEQVKAARRAWENEYIKGRTLPYEERQVVEEAIKRGVLPKSPEAPKLKQPDFTRSGSAEQIVEARQAWDRHNESKNVPEGERQAQRVLIAMGISPGDAGEKQAIIQLANFLKNPEIQRGYTQKIEEIGKLIPEQEVVRQQKEESKGVVTYMQLEIINPGSTTDEALKSIYDSYNRRLQKGLIALEGIGETIQNIERRLQDPVTTPEDRQIAVGIIDNLEDSMAREMQDQAAQRAIQLSRELTSQNRYTIRELLTNREARNWAVDNLFAGVDSRPHIQFQQAFSPLTYGMYYERLMDLIRNASIGRLEGTGLRENDLTEDQRRELAEDFQRYQAELRVREPLHNVNSILYAPSVEAKPLFDFMQQFSSELGDLAHRMPGVRQMMDIYEQALREDMMKNDGYLNSEALLGKVETSSDGKIINVRVGEVEEITKNRFRERNLTKRIVIKTADGKSEAYDKTFAPWEIDRIFTISRGMLLMSQRLITLAAESKLPNKGGGSQIGSSFLQDIIQGYSPYVHLLGKYGVTEKSLAAYLYKTNEGKSFLKRIKGIFASAWSTDDLRKATEMLIDKFNPFEVLDPSEMRYLARLNPNRAGDLFTWISWRLGDKPGMLTMSTDFLEKGGERMLIRVRKIYGISETIALEKASEAVAQVDYEWNLSEDDRKDTSKTKKDIIAANVFYHLDTNRLATDFLPKDPKDIPEEFRNKDWKNILKSEWPQGLKKICMKNIFNYLNEYSNWIGTAVRLEKLRGDIDKQHSSKLNERKDARRAIEEAKSIIGQMVKFQPHRLYLVSKDIKSKDIKKRTDDLLSNSPEFNVIKNRMIAGGMKEEDVIPAILDTLSLVESNLLQKREELLDAGEIFETASLDFDANSYRFEKRSDESYEDFSKRSDRFYQSLAAARIFAETVSEDFRNNSNQYNDEFIFKRENMHGFVLWTGDVPVDEFNMSKLGATGAFVRRARDGRDQAAAVAEEIKLLGSLQAVKTPEQLIQALMPIYKNISSYDPGKAKQAIGEKLEGFAKFFAADWRTDVPIFGFGMRMFGRSSMAQIIFGKGSPAWGSAELRSLLVQAHDGQMITDDKFKELKSNLFAGGYDITRDAGVTISQLLAIALLIYLSQRVLRGK